MGFARSISLDELADRLEAGSNALPQAVPKFLQAATITISGELKRGINAGTSPDGTPFKPLAHPRPSGGSAQPLRDNGLLLASLGGGPNHVQRITQDGLVLGTNLDYADVQQRGKMIEAKPGKALAIPLTREAKRAGKPTNFPRDLVMVWPKDKPTGTLFEVVEKSRGKKKKGDRIAQYKLVKKVTIPARPFVGFSDALKGKLAKLAGTIFGTSTGLTR